MDAAITMRSARLNCTLQWRTRPSETERAPDPSHRQGSQHWRREPLFVRENIGFRAIPNAQTWPLHSSSAAICNHLQSLPCKSLYNCIDEAGNPEHRCSHYPVRSARLNCTLEWRTRPSETEPAPDPSHRQGSQHRLLTPKHDCKTAVPLPSAIICNHCLANHSTAASTNAAIHNMDAAITVRSARLNCTLQWRTRWSANERSPHLSHRQGSQHRRREPLGARKHRV